MRAIDAPVVDDDANFVAVAAGRDEPTRSVLQNVSPRVVAAYEAYRESLPEIAPDALALTPAEGSALTSNYMLTYGDQALAWLRGAVRERAFYGSCPYCDTGQATTLDHYLPKEMFKEFSIYSRNLVPACPRCNNKRGQALYGPAGQMFWHAYLDDVPPQPVLFANIHEGETLSVTFFMDNPAGAEPALFAKLTFLYSELKLGEFFGIEATGFIYDMSPALSRQWYVGGADAVRAELHQARLDYETGRGRNTWKTAVLAALEQVNSFGAPCYDPILRPQID